MGKDTPRREANRVGRGGNGMKKKAIANLTTKKKTIVKAPREIRDIQIKKNASMSMDDGSASAPRKKGKPGKNLRKTQRKLSGSKKATRAKKEKQKHIN